MLDQQLHAGPAIELICIQAKRHVGALRQRVRMAEPDRVVALAILFQLQLQVAVFQHALADDAKLVAEHRRREALAPDVVVDQFDEGGREIRVFQRAVGFQHAFQLRPCQRRLSYRFERVRETLLSSTCQSRGYFKANKVAELLNENEKRGTYPKEVFSLLILELWHQRFLD